MNAAGYVSRSLLCFLPLLLSSLGGAASFRAGKTAAALPGVMIAGALAGLAAERMLTLGDWITLTAALLIAGCAGALVGMLAGAAMIRRKARPLIAGLALDALAAAALLALPEKGTSGRFGAAVQSSVTVWMGQWFFTPLWLPAAALLLIFWLILYRTPAGFRLRACGENPRAAESAGAKENALGRFGALLAGFLMGAGGYAAFFCLGSWQAEGWFCLSALALTAAWMGRKKMRHAAAASLLLSFIRTAAEKGGGIVWPGAAPQELIAMLPYFAALILLAACRRGAGPLEEA